MDKPFASNAALVLIDIQDGFDDPYWGKRNNAQAEANAARLLAAWRKSKRPVFHVQHLSLEDNSPLRADRVGSKLKDIVKPAEGEMLIGKHVNSAFIGTDLEARLRAAGIEELVLAGLTTDHCVSTSTRMAGNLGFTTYIVHDACATFDRVAPDGKKWTADEIHSSALASLHGEFATAISSDEAIRKLVTHSVSV
ncbi:MAG: cysteine hydrolase [Candidatus Obscuribacterales bacterium]|nr:cysteine hydrolase [Candidatus Obscuribacterales bacterium]